MLLSGTGRSEMKQLGQDIIDAQEAEIEQMRSWLDRSLPTSKRDISRSFLFYIRDFKVLVSDGELYTIFEF